jgi:putative peptide zinc metalloprotease protein
MSSLAATKTSVLPLARRDLEVVPIDSRGRTYWTVKDPVALRYYQLRDEEHFILGLLDGRLSLDEVVVRFEQRFAPRQLRRSELAGFLAMLHREGLVSTSAAGQGERLYERELARRWSALLATAGNVLAIRLPGINPDRFLSAVVPRLSWLFTPAWGAAALALILSAVLIVVVNFGVLVERLPRLHDFFGPGNIVWLAISLALVKSLHELGHAATCKHFGGECNRLGIMLLVFTPALYCDVTDAWMVRERGKRIAVSAAGVIVELILAAAATLVWAMTEPGWINALSLNIMFLCSVNTLLINGNPLLRYDGYYILADWLGTPNLQQQASSAIRRGATWLFTGVTLDQPRFLAEPAPWLLWSYALASTVYRAVVIVGILWLLDAALRPRGLAAISLLLSVVVLATVAAGPVSGGARFLRNPSFRRQASGRRFLFMSLLLAALLTIVAWIPLPARVSAPLVIRPRGGRQVYVSTPGVLVSATPAGERVSGGDTLAVLANRPLELEVAELESRVAQLELQVTHLSLRQHRDASLGEQLPTAEKQWADLRTQLAHKRRELAQLRLTAPVDGAVLPPPASEAERVEGQPSAFAGTPQQPQNLGCYLETGTLLCTLGDPEQVEALVIVAEHDLQGIRAGQSVRLALPQLPGQLVQGRVQEVSRLQSDDLPPQILAERMIPLDTGPAGRSQPLHTYYQVVVTLEPPATAPLVGATGWAKIAIDSEPLWRRVYRGVRGTFRTPW